MSVPGSRKVLTGRVQRWASSVKELEVYDNKIGAMVYYPTQLNKIGNEICCDTELPVLTCYSLTEFGIETLDCQLQN